MKVILLQDVAKIGRRFNITDVPDGYALNKLIPQKLAEPATPENVKRIQARASKIEKDQVQSQSDFVQALAKIADKVITLEVEANEEGRMFSALKAETVLEAIQNEVGVCFDQSQMIIKTPIKEVGEHRIDLVLGDTQGVLTVALVAK